MSFNLANIQADERNALEDKKAQMFEFWKQNLERARGEAGRIWGEKAKRKGQYAGWAQAQVEALEPEQYRYMVIRELDSLG